MVFFCETCDAPPFLFTLKYKTYYVNKMHPTRLFPLLIALLLAPLTALHAAAPSPASPQIQALPVYRKKLVYVIGDTKQGFIHNKITSRVQADNLLKGFHAMKVNGIRVPIFAAGLTPDRNIYDYFIRQAMAQGFLWVKLSAHYVAFLYLPTRPKAMAGSK